ncbi:MAG: MFS transporter, partial [Rhodocyclales bacterium]|nr:MFS transporter [Rhodocyclales bacterium]
LRVQSGGLPLAFVPLVLIVMNVVYAATAYPFGKLADSVSHATLLAWGLAILILADAALAVNGHWSMAWLGVVLWGLHMAMTQGLLAAMIADTAPVDLRGTAYGFFNLASGLAMLLASALAGLLWESLGASFTFIAGGVFGTLALMVSAARPAGRASAGRNR